MSVMFSTKTGPKCVNCCQDDGKGIFTYEHRYDANISGIWLVKCRECGFEIEINGPLSYEADLESVKEAHTIAVREWDKGYGYSIPGLVRDMLVSHFHIPYAEAVKFSDMLNERLEEEGCKWLETYTGRTFVLDFDPRNRAAD